MSAKVYKNILWFGLGVVLVFAPLARGATTTRLWAVTPVFLIVYALVFVWLWRVNNGDEVPGQAWDGKEKVGIFGGIGLPLWLFAGLAVVSFVFSIYKYDSFYALIRLFGYIGLFYLIAGNYSRGFAKYLAWVVICIGTGLSAYGLLQYFGVFPHEWWKPEMFLSATYVNHNHFAGYLEMAIPIAFGAAVSLGSDGTERGKRSLLVLLVTALVIMMAAFVFAQSRGAWICMGSALFVMSLVLVRRGVFRARGMIVLVSLVIGVVAFFYVGDGLVSKRIETMVKVNDGDASMGGRVAMWRGSVGIARGNVLTGVGIGCFEDGFAMYRPEELGEREIRPRYAHNEYLQMVSEMGVLAFPLMVWMICAAVGAGFRGGRRPGKISLTGGIVLGSAVGILSLSLHGLVDFNFHIPANMLVVVCFFGVIMGRDRRRRSRGVV